MPKVIEALTYRVVYSNETITIGDDGKIIERKVNHEVEEDEFSIVRTIQVVDEYE